MSGHSKWSQIKRQKAVTDNKRGNLFTKLGNAIAVAVKEGGIDSDTNFRLRMAIEKAKAANMPNDNVERAIKRGAGELAGAQLVEATYEGFGPAGIAIMIQITTDNKNRTASIIRNILTKHGGNLGGTGSVAWMFETKGVLRIAGENITDTDAVELACIDAGADDIITEDEGVTIYTTVDTLKSVRDALESLKIIPESVGIEFVPKDKVAIDDPRIQKNLEKIFEELDQDDDVSNYFTNADI